MPEPPARRLADSDRERITQALAEHYAQGRLSLEELRRRVEIVLTAEFTDDAARALTDLPAMEAAPESGRAARRHGRRHAQSPVPGPGWVPTNERFRDPSTGTVMRVWVDPVSRGRHYIPDDIAQTGITQIVGE